MSKPIVAIVGRPNVGKSTLFNRIVGKRIAIVEDTPGITRDRIYAEADWNGREFVMIDTGGILLNEADPLRVQVTAQAQAALEESDVVLFMVDADTGITPADREVADTLRGSPKPLFVIANKADNEARETDSAEFYELGLGEVIPVSSLNGRSVGDLLDAVVQTFPSPEQEPSYVEEAVRIAIIGRPNVGKSSLVNAILGEKRVVVSEIPGTTRDSVDTVLKRDDHTIILIDTAGIRKSGKYQGTVEYYTVLRAIRAMERADVAMILIDAADGLTDGDKRVAGFAHEAGRGCVIVVNKWDLCGDASMQEFADAVRQELVFMTYAPVVFTSAKTGSGVPAAVETAVDAASNHALRMPTGELNRILQDAFDSHPYTRKGRDLKLRYATMPDVKPPTIVAFVNEPARVHFSYERYLENQVRREYPYEGTPIRFIFRKGKKGERTMSWLALLACYIFGAIPFGLIVGKLTRGIDIRDFGSGNIGASNVLRTLGPGPALLVFLLDTAKGWGAVVLCNELGLGEYWVVAGALLSVLGHTFSVFLRFKGGKGVATSLGVIIGLNPVIAAIALGIWFMILGISRYVSVASVMAAISVPVQMVFWSKMNVPVAYQILAGVAALGILAKHIPNIKRLAGGVEPKIGESVDLAKKEGDDGGE